MAASSDSGGFGPAAGPGRPAGRLSVERLDCLGQELLNELAGYGRKALGEAALGPWQLPVIAAWGFLYVARLEGEVAGSAQAISCRQPGDVYMDIFYIREKYRGSGIGAAFLRRLKGLLAAEGYRRLLVTCDTLNAPAGRLFHSCGFEPARALADFYGQGRQWQLLAAALGEAGS